MNIARHFRLLIMGILLSTTCFNLYPVRRYHFYILSLVFALGGSAKTYVSIKKVPDVNNKIVLPITLLGGLCAASSAWFPWSFIIHSDDYKLERAQQQLETMKIQTLLSISFHNKEKDFLQLVDNNFESHGGQTMALAQALIFAEKTKAELLTLIGDVEKLAQTNVSDITFHANCKKNLLIAAECIKNLLANIKLLNELLATQNAC